MPGFARISYGKICVSVYTYISLFVFMYSCMYACMHACMYVNMYMYIHRYIYIYIYIYIWYPPPCTHAFLLNLSFGKVWVLGMPYLPRVRMAWILGLGESACKS